MPFPSSYHDAPAMPCSEGYVPVTTDDVAAGVMDGKIVVERSCIDPDSARRFRLGSLPVCTAGHMTRGDAASMTTSRTLTPGMQDQRQHGVIHRKKERHPRNRSLRCRQL